MLIIKFFNINFIIHINDTWFKVMEGRVEGRRRWERPGNRDRKEGNKSSFPKNLSSFSFSNFPDSHGEYEMFRIFQKWARVREVFISRRLNRWGRRFGFVKFYQVPDEGRLEKQLDQIFIGNQKLYVNLPKFRRAEDVKLNSPSKDNLRVSNATGRRKEKEVWLEKTRFSGRRSYNMKHSYAEMVRKTPQGLWNGPIIETTPNGPAWLSSSAVGWMSSGFTFDSMCEEFIKGGMSRIKLRYMGDNLVLLTPKNGERMEDVIRPNKE